MAKVRRKAVACKLVERSKHNDGYYKYVVTIKEKDGKINKQPAYGIDMQDAISRLVAKERTIKVEKKLTASPFLVFAIWLGVMSWPSFFMRAETTPWFLLYSFSSIILLFFGIAWWYNRVNKE